MEHELITIRPESDVPKYRQIIDSVLGGIEKGTLSKGEVLPSINEVSGRWSLARETVVRAYADLKERGAIASRPGKGYYVATEHVVRRINVFLLFDVMQTPYKDHLSQGIRDALKGRAHLDFYFHHHNPELFCKLLDDARGCYQYYVVMPFPDKAVRQALSGFEQDKLLLLDIDVDFKGKRCAVIRQNHDEELERALDSGIDRLRKYDQFILVFPEDRNHPQIIKDAFDRFCRRHGIRHRVTERLGDRDLRQGAAYLVIEDDDLVQLVKYARSQKLKTGRDIGILSYNDTPFKEIIEDGIAVVTIDFEEMGRLAAHSILTRDKVDILTPTRLIPRGSL